MKHCDRGIGDLRSRLSPLARPFTFGTSSSSSSFVQPGSSSIFSIAASESESEDSIWRDYAFDLSFLTSDDQRSGGLDDDSLSTLSRDADAATGVLKAEGSEPFRQAAYASVKDQSITPQTMRQDAGESFIGLSSFLESDLGSADSQPQVSPFIPMISTIQSNAVVNLKEGGATQFSSSSVLGHSGTTPAVNGVSVGAMNSGDGVAEGQLPYAKANVASFGKFLENQSTSEGNPSSFFSKTLELRIACSIDADNEKLDLHSANATGTSEKSSTPSDQDDPEVDSPCWRGTQSHKTIASSSKAMSSRRSSDNLNKFYGLNPLAPQFIPATAKKSLNNHAKACEESRPSSLKKSLSSTFPLSSGDCSLTNIPTKAVVQQNSGRTDRTTRPSFLLHNVDKSSGFASEDSVSNTVSILDSRNEFQISKKLDPSAPVFVPSSAKLSAAIHEKQGGVDHMVGFKTNTHSTTALSSLSNRLLNNVVAEMCPAEVDSSFGNQQYDGTDEPGTSGSFNPWLGSEHRITENASLTSPNDKLLRRHRLNPLARQFSLADTNQNLDGFDKSPAADNLLPVMSNAIASTSSVYRDHKLVDTTLVRSKSSVYMETYSSGTGMTQMDCVCPSKLLGSSPLKASIAGQSTKVDDRIGSVKQLVVDPKALPMKGNKDFDHFRSFHILEDSTDPPSSNMKAMSDRSPRLGCLSTLSSPEMDVKKLLTSMHGLSELLTLVHAHSCGSDPPNEQEVVLINSIMQNLNMYMRNRVEGHCRSSSNGQRASYDSNRFPNVNKLSIRDHRPPGANDKTNEKYSLVPGEILPHPLLRENGLTSGNGSAQFEDAQVVAKSAFQENHPTKEQINPQVLFYRSLWLKAEADRGLIEYEASLSKMKP